MPDRPRAQFPNNDDPGQHRQVTRPAHTHRRQAWTLLISATLATAILTTAASATFDPNNPQSESPATDQPTSEATRLGQRIQDSTLTAVERHHAAQDLWKLGETNNHPARDEIRRLIDADTEAAARLVRAAANLNPLRCWSAELIVAAGDRAELLNEAIASLASVRTPTGAAKLIELGKTRPGIEDAVVSSLTRLTMHPKPPATLAAWEATLSPLLSDSEAWTTAMLGWAFAEADRAKNEVSQLHTRLGTALRRQFAATNGTDERTALLASWLGDPMPMIRSLAVELAQRELVNARPLGTALGQAAVQLLQRPEASARRDGAQLLASVAVDPPPITELAAAIEQETDASSASALLETAARWPSPAYATGLLRWINTGGQAVATTNHMTPEFISAVRLLRSMLQSGWQPSENETPVLLSNLRATATANAMSPAAMQTLATLGDDSDRRTIFSVAISTDADAPQRSAAARALAEWNEWTGALVDAAGRDGALFDAACESAARFAATPEVVARLAATPDVPQDRLAAGITRVSASLDLPGRVNAAVLTNSPAIRVRLLAPMTGNGLAAVASPALQVRGLTLLAESQLAINEPTQAWATATIIEKSLAEHDIPALAGPADHERAQHAILAAAVASARIERFDTINASLRAWLNALERAPNPETASAAATTILRIYADTLDTATTARLTALTTPPTPPQPDPSTDNNSNDNPSDNPHEQDQTPPPSIATMPPPPETTDTTPPL